MRLIIGGSCQGKLEWYLNQKESREEVAEGGEIPCETIPQQKVLNHLHLWIGRMLKEGISPTEQVAAYLEQNPDAVILCDEVGCGLVPISGFDREWRETVGRICCDLAKDARQVDRIFCGIPTRMKGEPEECR